MTEKALLRKEFLSKRKLLDAGQLQSASLQICNHFKEFYRVHPILNAQVFLPIKRQHEIDTWPIIEFLRTSGVDIIVSKSDFETGTLEHFRLEESTIFEENQWGIPEPVNGKPVPAEIIELVIVPLVIFDYRGYRIGYGKGFYDKFLSKCSPKVIKIGLSLFPPVDSIDIDQFDIKMNYCITKEEIFTF